MQTQYDGADADPMEGLRLEITAAPHEKDSWQVEVFRRRQDGGEAVVDRWTCPEGDLQDARLQAGYILSHTLDYRLNDSGVEGLIPLAHHHVNEYHEKQVYGGPEEGGWYFQAGLFIRCLGIHWTLQAAQEQAAALQEYLGKVNEGARELSSVISTGRRRIVVEPHPGEDYPSQRPQYE